MDRRSFLILGGAALAYPLARHAFHSPVPAPPADFELASGFGRWVDSAIDRTDPSLPSRLIFFNPGNGAMADFAVPFRVHMTVQNSRRPEQLVLISKWGAEIASFNRITGQIEAVERARANHRYFGHAVWDAEENGFWVTEQDDGTLRGKIVLRGADLSLRREVSSHGLFPHDVQMPEPGLLAVANNGDYYGLEAGVAAGVPVSLRFSNLSWIRAKDGELIRQVQFPELLGRAGASHFQFLNDRRTVFVGGKTKHDDDPSVVMRIDGDGRVQTLTALPRHRDNYQGEAVSFAIVGDRVVWTHSKEKGVFSATFEGSEAELMTSARTRGIAAVGTGAIVSHAKKPLLLEMNGGKIVREIDGPKFAGHRWGSHLSRIKAV